MIVAGDYSLAIYEGTEQQIIPQLLVPHPDYNSTTNNNDIMLIKVQPANYWTLYWKWNPFLPSLVTLSILISPAEGAGLSEQLRVHRSAAPARRLHSGGESVPSVRLGIHQPWWRPDPLHPPHCQAPHRLHWKMQQQWVLRWQDHRKHALCWLQHRWKGRLSGKSTSLFLPGVWMLGIWTVVVKPWREILQWQKKQWSTTMEVAGCDSTNSTC